MSPPAHRWVQFGLYLYIVLVVCPIRYWPLGAGIDETWRFAINQAHAQGLTPGTDIIFTSGPLGFLIFPENIGSNLWQGLLFQSALWIFLSLLFADVFFRCEFSLRNLGLFSFCFGLSAYLFWFDFIGLDSVVLACALTLLVVYRARGSPVRYVTALVLIGLLPFIKLTAAIIALTALLGFLCARFIESRWHALQELLLAAIVPAGVALALCLLIIPSRTAFLAYLRGSFEMVAGYSAAMSQPGPLIQLVGALVCIALLATMVRLPMGAQTLTIFYGLFLAGPMFMAFKHGFVRQDHQHVAAFFCYVALALALVTLNVDLQDVNVRRRALILISLFFALWAVNRTDLHQFLDTTGLRGPLMLVKAFPINLLEHRLEASRQGFPSDSKVEPEIVQAIADVPVASLSYQFTNLSAAQLQVQVYPAIQRYSAYTPYLDNLDAGWIREQGPRFLLFDGKTLDGRDTWAETPAMWLEVYRWYDSRLLGKRNLLLERRAKPRFRALETLTQIQFAYPGKFQLPPSPKPIFWTMKCDPEISIHVVQTLFRSPAFFMSLHNINGLTRKARVIPGMLVLPTLGNFLPYNLEQFSRFFETKPPEGNRVDEIALTASGIGSQASTCQVELMTPSF